MKSNTGRIVSSDADRLILVDQEDREIGNLDKASCHDGNGVLHRAFSLFLFNDAGELLLQQRGAAKRLWPLFWSNSCCSHPRAGESTDAAAHRRLRDELNIDAELEFVYKFTYEANFGELGSENELCWVYLGRSTCAVAPNEHEIAATRLVTPDNLEAELNRDPGNFTPWFQLEWRRLRRDFPERLERYRHRH